MLTEPKELSYFNMDLTRDLEVNIGSPDSYLEILLDLSEEVKIEERKVTSILDLLGDLGGL